MKKLFSSLFWAVAIIYGGAYLLHRFPLTTQASQTQQAKPDSLDTAQPADSEKAVTLMGPLADYMQNQKGADSHSQAVSAYEPSAKDLIVDSPVGTGGVILHKTFGVTTTVKFPFEIPAHVTNPELHGTYHSSWQSTADGNANVEFLLMNQQQYADFSHGRQADVLYFVESSHSQQINFELAPTYDKPMQYCLVFRNRTQGSAKKIVQADFSVDF